MKWTRPLTFIVALGLLAWVVSNSPDSSSGEEQGVTRPLPASQPLAVQSPMALPTRSVARVELEATPEAAAVEEQQGDKEWTDEELQELFEEQAAEDPIQAGPCTLELSAIWENSGIPAATHFKLYRLDVPENELYTEGDQLQVEGDLPLQGKLLRLLPEGEYRVMCLEASRTSRDPRAFRVAGDVTKIVLRLTAPPTAEAHLLVFDENGIRVEQIDRSRITHEPGDSFSHHVPWVKQRHPKSGFHAMEGSPSFSSWGEPPVEHLVATQAGFYLAQVKGASKQSPHRSRQDLGRPGYNDLQVPLSWEGEGTATWVGLLVPLERITGALWFEYGHRPDPQQLDLTVTCIARMLDGLPELEPWSTLTIDVTAKYPGYKTLKFSWTPGDGPLEDRFMQQTE